MKLRSGVIGVLMVMGALASAAQNTYPWPSMGNVGIGTTGPVTTLDVQAANNTHVGIRTGQADGTAVQINAFNNGGMANIPMEFKASYFNFTVGNVGIGTTTPAAKLDVSDQVTIHSGITKASAYTIGNATSPLLEALGAQSVPQAGANPAIAASGFGFVSGNSQVSPVIWVYSYAGQNAFRVISKSYATNITSDPVLFDVDSGGNVGIGTTTPGQKLEVNGNILLSNGSGGSMTFADGSTQTTAWTGSLCGGDYAESVDVTGDRHRYGPGDVLQIDDEDPSHFVKVASPYSKAVAGVYSTKPGALGRRQTTPKSPDEVPLAMIGIVPVKVSAENGPIRPHDLLVSSTRAGYAMKGTDTSRMLGAVIGKAMGSLDKGDGVIEVLVTLQ